MLLMASTPSYMVYSQSAMYRERPSGGAPSAAAPCRMGLASPRLPADASVLNA